MLGLTEEVNAPARAFQAVVDALKVPGRRRYFADVLADKCVDNAFRELFVINDMVRTRLDWNALARKYQLNAARASLLELCYSIVQKHREVDTDERYVDLARRAIGSLLRETVGNNYSTYEGTEPAALIERFDPTPLQSTSARFLASLIRETVRSDVLRLSDESRARIGEAALKIANQWVASFEEEFPARSHRDVLAAVSRELPKLVERLK
jgi:hypothetical protein